MKSSLELERKHFVSMEGKLKNRSTKPQIKMLCQYMAQHPDFAAGEFKTPQGAASHQRQWAEVKAALDELGPERSVEQWKICWRDQKRKARQEGGAQRRALVATGNNKDVPEVSENAVLILSTIGVEMATGTGLEESPIGFSNTASTSANPPANPSANPPPNPPSRAPVTRVRKSQPPDRFLDAQKELNSLIKSLVNEVRRSNDKHEETNKYIRILVQKFASGDEEPEPSD